MLKTFFIGILSLLFIFGLNTNIASLEQTSTQPSNQGDNIEQDKSYTPTPVKVNVEKKVDPIENPAESADRDDKETMQYIRDNITVGQSPEDVEKMMGDGYRVHLNSMEGTNMWSYDLFTKEDYQFIGEMDEVDIEGLKKGDVKIILSINWNDQTGKSDFISVHYVSDKQNTLCNYRVFENGLSKDSCHEY